jgi:hypothetical protein
MKKLLTEKAKVINAYINIYLINGSKNLFIAKQTQWKQRDIMGMRKFAKIGKIKF